MSLNLIPIELLPYFTGTKTDNSSLQNSILRISVSFAVLVVITTTLRFWVRFHMLRAVGADDVLMMIALVFALLLSASCLIGSHYGLGKHLWNIAGKDFIKIPEQIGKVTKALYGCYLSYAVAIAFVKFSIIATYFRIFPDGNLRRIFAVVGFVVFAMMMSNIFAIIFTCIPVEGAWDYQMTEKKCFDIVSFFYASSAINIATDVALCFLPLPTFWGLSMPRSQRLVLCVLFSLGAFTCAASILRLQALYTARFASADVSYGTVNGLLWCVIEVGTAITCSSLSSLRPLATRYLPKFFSHLTNSDLSGNITNTNRGTKLSSISHSRALSDHFASKNREGENDGQITIQQTFHMTEEWTGSDSKESAIYNRTRDMFNDGSSEEDLVNGRKGIHGVGTGVGMAR